MESKTIEPQTVTSLAAKYKVSWKTMQSWLKKIGMEKPMTGYIFTPEEVSLIIRKLGEYD